ncbi:unnamed protein product [Pedinophyceae sp. YPF-701]|nr:unnamed protein product [Pedinophyceae sp. YPF-701]
MSGIGTGYDLSTTTYSPDGRVFQIDYAQKAVDSSGTAIGIRCKDGVVVAVEKPVISKMLVEGSNRAVFPVHTHAGLAATGVPPDSRMVVNHAMDECSRYKSFYGEDIPGHVLAERLGGFFHTYTLVWYVRPFGAAALVAVYGDDGPQLYLCEPNGNAHRFFGTAIGKGRQAAKTEIERLDLQNITCREAVAEIAKMMYKLRDDEKPFELEMGWVSDESGRKFVRVPADLVAQAESGAKAAMESDMEDD